MFYQQRENHINLSQDDVMFMTLDAEDMDLLNFVTGANL